MKVTFGENPGSDLEKPKLDQKVVWKDHAGLKKFMQRHKLDFRSNLDFS